MAREVEVVDLGPVPYVLMDAEKIIDCSSQFLQLTGYEKADLLDHDIQYFFRKLIRLNVDLAEIEQNLESFFIFTKGLEPREVKITMQTVRLGYALVFHVNQQSRFANKKSYINQLIKSNFSGIAVYTPYDFTLVRASQKYLDFLEPPYNCAENSLGRKIHEIIPDWLGSPAERHWREAIASGEAVQVKEYEHTGYKRGVTYWDSVITPVFEQGVLKYVISNTSEITEKVVNRKKVAEQAAEIKQQKERLEAVIESMADALIVYSKDGSALLANEQARRVIYQPDAFKKMGDSLRTTHYFDLQGNKLGLQDLPAWRSLQGETVTNFAFAAQHPDKTLYISASSTPVYNTQGEIEYAVVCMRDITERVHYEKLVQEKNELLEAIMDNMQEAMLIFDAHGKYIFVNKAGRSRFEAEIENMHDVFRQAEFYHLDGTPIDPDDMVHSQVIRGKQVINQMMRMKTGNEELYLITSGSPIFDKQGRFLYGVITNRNVTEQFKRDEIIGQQAEQLQIITENMSDALFIINADGTYNYLSKSAMDMAYQAEAIKKHGDSGEHTKYYDMDGILLAKEEFAGARVLGGEKIENLILRAERPDKTVFYSFNGSPVYDAEGKVALAVLCIRDITQQFVQDELLKMQQFALLEAEKEKELHEKMTNIIEGISDVFFSMDSEWKCTYMNREAEKLLGAPRQNFIGENMWELYPKTQGTPLYEKMHQAVQENKPVNFEMEWAGGNILFEIKAYPYKDGISVFYRDITEQRKIMAELAKAEKISSIAVLAGGIAHDFNNILTVIIGGIQLVKFRLGKAPLEKINNTLDMAINSAFEAKALTNQLLTFSKGGNPVKAVFSLAELVKKAAEFVLLGSNVKGEFYLDANLWKVEADEGQINQVINNLVINAMQAMPEGGKIEISGENVYVDDDGAAIYRLKAGEYVKVAVKDYGCGITPQDIQNIFDPYFTTKDNGSGLGLAVCYSIIKSHGGIIVVESTQGLGTEFAIYLPATRNEVSIDRDMGQLLLSGRGRILVMDDNARIRDFLATALGDLGYEVQAVMDGTQAVEAYRKVYGTAQAFAAVILDLTIPGEMGGKATIKCLQEIDPQIKAVVSSGYSEDAVMADHREYGFSAVVPKPYKIEDLSRILYELTRKEN